MAAAKSSPGADLRGGFLPCSFGFRPKHSAHQALEVVRTTVNRGAVWVLDADISDCFGSSSFDAIVSQVERRVSDRKMLKLIRAWLRVGVFENGVVTDSVSGAPQGSPVSPLIANIVLHVLDVAWSRQGQGLGTLVRYCDDFVVLAPTKAKVIEAKARIEAILATLGLRLHPDKTRIVCLTEGAGGLCVLGFRASHARARGSGGAMVSQQVAVTLGPWPRSRPRSSSARPDVCAAWPLDDVVADLNPVLRGWGNYFRRGNSSRKFNASTTTSH